MEIVKGNTAFINAGQTPHTWRVLLNVLGPLFCTLLAKLRMIDDDEVVLEKSQKIPNCMPLFGTAHMGMGRVVTPWGRVVGDGRPWRDKPFYAISKQMQWQFLESLGEDKFVMQLGALHIKDMCQLMIPTQKQISSLMVAPNDHQIKSPRYAHQLSLLSLSLNWREMHIWLPIHVEILAEHLQ